MRILRYSRDIISQSTIFGEIYEYIESRRSIIDKKILDEIKDYETEIKEIARYITDGGKRLRGVLTILVSEALGGSIDDALDAAVAIEMVHSASLALDDIIDKDLFRRGRPSTWIKFGISQTVLVSNFLIPKAQLMIKKYGFEALLNVIQSWLHATLGEILDAFGSLERLLPHDYERIIDLKTGSVFKMAAYLGAKASKASEEVAGKISEYGEYLGRSYQVADDLTDVLSEDPDKKKSNSVRLFIRWIGYEDRELLVNEASKRIIYYLERCLEKVKDVSRNRYSEYLIVFPVFAVYSILREAGEVGLKIFYEKIYPNINIMYTKIIEK